MVVATAGLAAVLYFLFVLHYSFNVPWSIDDWSIIPIVNAALHGHLSLGALWSQYGNRRLVMSRVVFVAFGFVDGLNEQAVMLFSAAIFVASYVLILLLFRSYLGRDLTPMPVLVVGVVWFSLADFLNALWSFQLSWFLVEFFFVLMTYFLLIPPRQKRVFLYLGIAAAVAGSLSDVQGLCLWPIGLICILWSRVRGRRVRWEVATWVAAASITMSVYFRGYSFANTDCVGPRCSPGFELRHPVLMAKYFVFLVGNVAPRRGSAVSGQGFLSSLQSIGQYELLGTVICLVAGYVVIQTIRHRSLQRNPLPLLLIAFGVLFDSLIIESREGGGIARLTSGQYVMPNLLLLLGIVIYACAHIPDLAKLRELPNKRRYLCILSACALATFLVAQFGWATEYGIAEARVRHQSLEIDARVLANQKRIPSTQWPCYTALTVFLWGNPDRLIGEARRGGISFFHSRAEVRTYEAQGPPLISQCVLSQGSTLATYSGHTS